MRPAARATLSACTVFVNLGLTVSGYTNFYLACALWAIAVVLALWSMVPWLAGLWLTPLSANEQPHKMGRDTPAAPSQIAPTLDGEPDIWLSNAMWRAFLRTDYIPEGGVSSIEITEPEKQRFVTLIIDEFRQLALDGKLPIWGRGKDPFILEPVPRDFWRRNQIDHVAVARLDHPEEVKACAVRPWDKPDTSADWHHFKTSKAVIERLYPSPQ
jgi:membrane protein implicated in regulation of membrane protease activity